MSTNFAIFFCILAAAAVFTKADVDEEVRSQILRLESLVLDLSSSKTQMKHEIQQLKQDFETKLTAQDEVEKKLAAQENENAALRKKLDDLEQRLGESCAGSGKDGASAEKRLVLSGAGVDAAFTVYMDHANHNMTSNQAIIYNKVLLNQGGFYDVTTGKFNAPASGIYLFSYSVAAKVLPHVNRTQYDIFTKLVIDGDHQLSAVAESKDLYDDEQGSTTAVLYVAEGSQVWTAHQVRGGNSIFSSDEERITSFTGVLLYQDAVAGITGRR